MQFAGIHRRRGRVFVIPSYHMLRLYSDMVGARPLPIRLRSSGYDIQDGNRRTAEIPIVPHVDSLSLISADARTPCLYAFNRNLDQEIMANIVVRGGDFRDGGIVRRLSARFGGSEHARAPRGGDRHDY